MPGGGVLTELFGIGGGAGTIASLLGEHVHVLFQGDAQLMQLLSQLHTHIAEMPGVEMNTRGLTKV